MRSRRLRGDPQVAVGYIRASRNSQKLTPEAQRSAILAWALQHGVQVLAFFEDLGVRSTSAIEERAGLTAALEALTLHGAGVLIVAKRDRIARRPALTEAIEMAAAVRGATVLSADGMSSGSGIQGIILKGMTDLIAQVERELISTRTREALAAKKAQGVRLGQIPYGWVRSADKRDIVPVAREQAAIQRASELYSSFAWVPTLADISRILAEEGYVSRKGTPFAPTQVQRLISRARELAENASISR